MKECRVTDISRKNTLQNFKKCTIPVPKAQGSQQKKV